jgi:hypothetical protein
MSFSKKPGKTSINFPPSYKTCFPKKIHGFSLFKVLFLHFPTKTLPQFTISLICTESNDLFVNIRPHFSPFPIINQKRSFELKVINQKGDKKIPTISKLLLIKGHFYVFLSTFLCQPFFFSLSTPVHISSIKTTSKPTFAIPQGINLN